MNKQRFAFVALAASLAIAPVAKADSFTFSFTGPGGVSGSGTLIGTDQGVINGNEAWLLTSGTGVFDDGAKSGPITLVPNPFGPLGSSLSPSGYFTYDDLLYAEAGPGNYLDSEGLLFGFGGLELNLYDFFGDGWYENNGNNSYGTLIVSSDVSTIPEPGSWLTLGTGLLVLISLCSRRSRLSGPVSNL